MYLEPEKDSVTFLKNVKLLYVKLFDLSFLQTFHVRTKIDVNKALKHKDLTNLSRLSSPKGIVLETKLIHERRIRRKPFWAVRSLSKFKFYLKNSFGSLPKINFQFFFFRLIWLNSFGSLQRLIFNSFFFLGQFDWILWKTFFRNFFIFPSKFLMILDLVHKN